MPEDKVSQLDNRVYELAHELGEIKSTVAGLVDDMKTLRAQLWYVITAAILGPFVATLVQHLLWK